ncbi:AfsA-related hotdog domain-containing protein [Streptomyces sp. NPDC006984]|uniref:AfsA-related hotdog domain-containing protein n=1 Tax=Streptomyces sp. NPDC006984 TaxID=3155463 RepID=UPI0033D36615
MTSTVPRELVHRAAVAEVFLTGWSRTAENQFALTAQWPRAHSYFTPVNGCYDPLLASETIRQVGTLLSHAEFGVPFGDQFLMWDLHHSVRPELAGVGAAPADLELDVICSDIRRRGRRLAGMRYEVTLYCGGQVIATGGAAFHCTSPPSTSGSAATGPVPRACGPCRSRSPLLRSAASSPRTSSCPPPGVRWSGSCGWTNSIPYSSTTRSTTFPAWC